MRRNHLEVALVSSRPAQNMASIATWKICPATSSSAAMDGSGPSSPRPCRGAASAMRSSSSIRRSCAISARRASGPTMAMPGPTRYSFVPGSRERGRSPSRQAISSRPGRPRPCAPAQPEYRRGHSCPGTGRGRLPAGSRRLTRSCSRSSKAGLEFVRHVLRRQGVSNAETSALLAGRRADFYEAAEEQSLFAEDS